MEKRIKDIRSASPSLTPIVNRLIDPTASLVSSLRMDTEAIALNQGNPFTDIFLPRHGDLIDEILMLDKEVRAEKDGWMGSRVAEELARRIQPAFPGFKFEKDISDLTAVVAAGLYGNTINGNKSGRLSDLVDPSILQQLQRPIREELASVFSIAEQHTLEYRKAIHAAEAERESRERQFLSELNTFLLEGKAHIEAFCEFLTAPDLEEQRKASSDLLKTLQRLIRPNNPFLNSFKRSVLDNESSAPSYQWFKEFLEDFMVGKRPNNLHNEILEWLRFSSGTITPDAVLERIRSNGIFPSRLRRVYTEFIDPALKAYEEKIIRALSPYGEEEKIPVLRIRYSRTENRHKRMPSGNTLVTISSTPFVDNRIEVPRTIYGMALPGKHEPASSDEITRYGEIVATSLSRHDDNTLHDIMAIIQDLIESPHGLGTSKIIYASVLSPFTYRRLPLWHYNPRDRTQVHLLRSESGRLRAVYYFDKRHAPNLILLEEIISHEAFDKKYRSS